MEKELDSFIRSLDVAVCRNVEHEKVWRHDKYSDQVSEELAYHCGDSFVSEYLRCQISKMIHQGYVLFGETPCAVPVRVVYEVMNSITKGQDGRGRLKHVSKSLGVDILHVHFGQSSFITENWVTHAKNTKLANQPFEVEILYNNLISSLSKPKKTGEWLVYSKSDSGVKFWCTWLHGAGDDELIEVIREQSA